MNKVKKSSKLDKFIDNIVYPYKDNWDKTKTHVLFDIRNINLSFVNSIRRSIISDVETYCPKSYPYKESTIQIIKNDSSLTNQIIQHRISLIPVNITDEDFDVNNYEFIINETNDDTNFKEITSNHIKIRRLSDSSYLSKEVTKQIFMNDPLIDEPILITKLKPSYTNNSSIFENENNILRFHIVFKLVKGSGSVHSCFMPHSAISCFFKEDPELIKVEREKFVEKEIKKLKSNNLKVYKRDVFEKIFDTTHKQRCYYKDEAGNPNYFVFLIESIGCIPPLVIFDKGIKKLIDRINNFEINLKSNNTNIITTKPSNNILIGFEILVSDESDTLGNIIQDFIASKYCGDDEDGDVDSENDESGNESDSYTKKSFIGYKQTHPLEQKILFNVYFPEYTNIDDIISNIIVPSCQSIIKILNQLSKNVQTLKEFSQEVKKMKKIIND